MRERQASEQRRHRKYQSIQLFIYVLLTLAIAVLAGFTAHLNDLIDQLTSQTISQMRAVQTGVAATSAATNVAKQTLEEINSTLHAHQQLLTRALAENRIAALLPAVDSYLDRLEMQGELEFDSPEEKADISRRLKGRIRPSMVNEIILKPDITDAQARTRIEQLADRALDAILEQ